MSRMVRMDVTDAVCTGDLDGDGTVNIGDLLEILSQWGTCTGGCPRTRTTTAAST